MRALISRYYPRYSFHKFTSYYSTVRLKSAREGAAIGVPESDGVGVPDKAEPDSVEALFRALVCMMHGSRIDS